MKYISFDLEIAQEIKEGEEWEPEEVGISFAAALMIHPDGRDHIGIEWMAGGKVPASRGMTQGEAVEIVDDLESAVESGYRIVTVNGLSFDFRVLAAVSRLPHRCARLARDCQTDLLYIAVCRLGWRVGLDALARGANVKEKLHQVTLNNGEVMEEMNGAAAPKLWSQGEFKAVMAYLREDVRATLEVAEVAEKRKRLFWLSKAGKPYTIVVPATGLPTVAECSAWPEPDQSWMTDPPNKWEMLKWTTEA